MKLMLSKLLLWNLGLPCSSWVAGGTKRKPRPPGLGRSLPFASLPGTVGWGQQQTDFMPHTWSSLQSYT